MLPNDPALYGFIMQDNDEVNEGAKSAEKMRHGICAVKSFNSPFNFDLSMKWILSTDRLRMADIIVS